MDFTVSVKYHHQHRNWSINFYCRSNCLNGCFNILIYYNPKLQYKSTAKYGYKSTAKYSCKLVFSWASVSVKVKYGIHTTDQTMSHPPMVSPYSAGFNLLEDLVALPYRWNLNLNENINKWQHFLREEIFFKTNITLYIHRSECLLILSLVRSFCFNRGKDLVL